MKCAEKLHFLMSSRLRNIGGETWEVLVAHTPLICEKKGKLGAIAKLLSLTQIYPMTLSPERRKFHARDSGFHNFHGGGKYHRNDVNLPASYVLKKRQNSK